MNQETRTEVIAALRELLDGHQSAEPTHREQGCGACERATRALVLLKFDSYVR